MIFIIHFKARNKFYCKGIGKMLNYIIQKYRDMKFRRKLLISYILLSIIPIMILGIHSYQQSKALLVEQADNLIKHSFSQAVGRMDSLMDKFNSVSDYISFDKNIMNALNSDYKDNNYELYYNYTYIIKPNFNSMMYLQPDIIQITVYNSGNLVRHGTTVLPLEELYDKEWFSGISENYENTWIYDNGRIFIFRKLISDKNSVSNYLCMYLKNDNIFNELKQITENYGLFVADSRGQVIYSYNNFTEDNMQYELSSEQLEAASSTNEENYLIMDKALSVSNWKVVFYKPIATLDFDVSIIVKAVLFAIAICIVMLFVFSIIFSNIMVKRIELLSLNMKYMNEKEFKNVITSNDKDEIGELIRSFNYMIQEIDTLINEVYHSKLKEKEAEMRALQAQINPHFLYNVLSSINWKAIMISADEISRTSQLLANFYRTALNGGKNIISIKEELENTKSYIEIQSILHNGNFIAVYDIDEEIYQYHIIKLLLQPIVENAIEHGLDCKINGNKILQVSAGICGNVITFAVKDNGPGIEKDTAGKLLDVDSKGYGLKNVNERIKLYFGEEYGVNIDSIVNVGTNITVTVPIVNNNMKK